MSEAEARGTLACFEFDTEQLVLPVILHRMHADSQATFVPGPTFSQKFGETGTMADASRTRFLYKGHPVEIIVGHAPYEFLDTFAYRVFYRVDQAGALRLRLRYIPFNLGTTLGQTAVRHLGVGRVTVGELQGMLSSRDQFNLIKAMVPVMASTIADGDVATDIESEARSYLLSNFNLSAPKVEILVFWWLQNLSELRHVLDREIAKP